MPFIFIIHHLSIVLQSVDDRRATAICMVIIQLAISWADIHIAILCQTEAREVFFAEEGATLNTLEVGDFYISSA